MAQAQNPQASTTGQSANNPSSGQPPAAAPAQQPAAGATPPPNITSPVSGTDANGQPMYSVNPNVYTNNNLPSEHTDINNLTNKINGQTAFQAQTPQQQQVANATAGQSAATAVNQQGFNAQAQNLQMLQQQAAGGGPAAQAVQMQSQNAISQGINAQMAMAGSMRGGNAGEALRQASVGQANVTGQAANQAAMNTLQSEQQGITNAGSVAGSMQGESLQGAQLGQQNNQFNAGQNTQVSLANSGAQNAANAQTQQLGEQTALANAGAQNTQQQFMDTSDVGLQNNGIALDQNQYGNNIAGAQYQAGSANDVTQANAGHQISQQNANTSAAGTAISGIQTAANVAQGIGSVASDRKVKKEIEAGDPDAAAFLDALKAKTWDYRDPEKHGEGEHLGVMAQDLQKSKMGDGMVSPDDEGTLRVNYGGAKGMAAMVASLAYLNDKIKSLESKRG